MVSFIHFLLKWYPHARRSSAYGRKGSLWYLRNANHKPCYLEHNVHMWIVILVWEGLSCGSCHRRLISWSKIAARVYVTCKLRRYVKVWILLVSDDQIKFMHYVENILVVAYYKSILEFFWQLLGKKRKRKRKNTFQMASYDFCKKNLVPFLFLLLLLPFSARNSNIF